MFLQLQLVGVSSISAGGSGWWGQILPLTEETALNFPWGSPPFAAVSWSLLQHEGGWGWSLQCWAEPDCLSFPPVRIKRIRDKYEVELQELERSERKLQERCNELKGRLAELEGESIRLQGLLKHKEQEVEEIQKVGALPGSVPLHCSVPVSALMSPFCPAAGEGPAGPGAEQPGRSDPAGVC